MNKISHLENTPFAAELAENKKIVFVNRKFSTRRFSALVGRLWYYWCLFATFFFISVLGLFVVFFTYLLGRRDKIYDWCYWGAEKWLQICGAKVEISGLENVDNSRAYVIISNHRSYLDTAVMFRYAGRRVGVIAKKELLKLPIAGYLMKNIDIPAIDRSNPKRAVETMQEACDIIKRGISLGIYAEGTRALPNELLPFKKGAFHLALQTGAPILPMVMKNSDELLGKRTQYAQPGILRVKFLEPIETTGFTEETLQDLRDLVRTRIAEEMAKE